MKFLALFLFPLSLLCASDYFVDAISGKDTNDGLSESTAWRSLVRVNKAELEPGDRILLKSGHVFEGLFHATRSGAESKPIVLTSYGEGVKPTIAAEGKTEMAVHLENVEYWIIDGIEVSNKGPERQAKRKGILVTGNKGGVLNDIVIRNNVVRDVYGVFSKDEGGGAGICWDISNRPNKTRMDGLIIENNHLIRCDRDAIRGWMKPWNDLSNLSTNTVIRGNLLEDIGGDGIVIIGMDGAMVEYNRIYGLRKRIENINTDKDVSMYAGPSIGIWPWSSNNTHVRYNEVWGYEGTFDGQGLDSDYNCDNTLFEYNWSADNKGGFFLICTWSKWEETGHSIGNTNTTIRHNVSFNDYTRGFVLNGPVRDVSIYGNILYNTIEDELQLVIDTPWDAGIFAHSVSIKNNLFFTKGMATITKGYWHPSSLGTWQSSGPINQETVKFEGNAYSNVSSHNRRPHSEPGMLELSAEETFTSLKERLYANPGVKSGFQELMKFMRESRYWPVVEQAL